MRYLILALISLSLTLHAQTARAAPVPPIKPTARSARPKPLIQGTYDLYWAGTPWRTTLSASGAYESRWKDITYRGWWAYCPRRHEVTITERVCGPDNARWQTWTQPLDRKWAGGAVYELTASKVDARWRRVGP